MKKSLALVLALIFILPFVGCASKAYELPHDQFCYSIDNSQAVELKTADKKYIVNLLNDASWTNDLSNCGSEFVFYTQKQEIRYHSECGTFNDITNKKSTTVTEEQRIAINTILEINDEPVSDKVSE